MAFETCVSCPNCGYKGRFALEADGRLRCPECGHGFDPAASEYDVDTDETRRGFLRHAGAGAIAAASVGALGIATETDEAEAMLFPAGNNYEFIMSKPVDHLCGVVPAGVAAYAALAQAGIVGGSGVYLGAGAATAAAGCEIRSSAIDIWGRDAVVDVYEVEGDEGEVSDGDRVLREHTDGRVVL